jgi:hypothetical protein
MKGPDLELTVTHAPHTAAPEVDNGYYCVMPVGSTTMYVTVADPPGTRALAKEFPDTFTSDCALAPWVHHTQSLFFNVIPIHLSLYK